MIAETYNNVWGYTCNPYNRNCSSGGSSGGESALLAMKGQCFKLNAYLLLQLIGAPLLKAPPWRWYRHWWFYSDSRIYVWSL